MAYSNREQLREQHELTQEIGNAITSMPITDPVDEDELESELEALEQENLDKELLKTGTVPVADRVNALPQAANGPSPFRPLSPFPPFSRFSPSHYPSIVPACPFSFQPLVLVRKICMQEADQSFSIIVKGKATKVTAEEDEEEELRKLQAEMAM